MLLLAQKDPQPLIDFTLAPLLEDTGLPLAVMGVLVVFAALLLLATFTSLLPRVLQLVSAEQPEAPRAEEYLGEEELSEVTVAVITAAVNEVVGVPSRIIRIRDLPPEGLGWSLEGRMQHHHSHRIQGGDRR